MVAVCTGGRTEKERERESRNRKINTKSKRQRKQKQKEKETERERERESERELTGGMASSFCATWTGRPQLLLVCVEIPESNPQTLNPKP